MASPSLPTLRRTLLYVPASSQRFLAKSRALTPDNVTFDLEDSVTPGQKPIARAALSEHLAMIRRDRIIHTGEIAVRINAVTTKHAVADIQAVARFPTLDTIVVPKVNSAADLLLVEDVIRQAAPERSAEGVEGQRPIQLLALIESARAIMDLREICGATPRLRGLIFAAEDFALDAGLQRTAGLGEMAYARSAIVTAARAFKLESVIDAVCTQLGGANPETRMINECNLARAFGFNGKQCVHPDQVPLVQRLFTPPMKHVEHATRIVIANERAEEEGRGAFVVDGKMIDAPEVGKAHALLARAKQCRINIGAVRKIFENQIID